MNGIETEAIVTEMLKAMPDTLIQDRIEIRGFDSTEGIC